MMRAGMILLSRFVDPFSALSQVAAGSSAKHRLPLTDSHYKRVRSYIEDEPVPEYRWASEAAYEAFQDMKYGVRIHWGLYSVPAGEWNGQTNHAEWIRTTAQIPLTTYDKFVEQFNPIKFNIIHVNRTEKMPFTFRAAFTHPEFAAKRSAYPPSAVASPHLFQKVAVPGICVA